MKKTLVDLIYVPFPIENHRSTAGKFYSTIGYLGKMDFSTYFVLRTTTPTKVFKHNKLRMVLLHSSPLKKWQIPFGFNCFIKSLKPDYVLAHGFSQIHFLAFLKIVSPRIKIVLQCNGFLECPRGWKRWIYKVSDLFIDGYLFTGVENASSWYTNKTLSKNKIFEVMEGSVGFKADNRIARKDKSFLWVGRLDDNKDPMTILKAFELFLPIEPAARLTMVFHEESLLKDIITFLYSNPLLSQAVVLKGFVPHQNLEAMYNSNRYFVLGSHYEGSGYALVEAMACGCVPIITNIPPFRYMTDNGRSALLFSPGNVPELLLQLKETQAMDYPAMQEKVLHQFKTKLSFEAIAKKIEQIFDSL